MYISCCAISAGQPGPLILGVWKYIIHSSSVTVKQGGDTVYVMMLCGLYCMMALQTLSQEGKRLRIMNW